MADCIVDLQTSLILLIFHVLCLSFLVSILWKIKIFAKYCFATLQAGVVFYDIKVDDDLMYYGTAS